MKSLRSASTNIPRCPSRRSTVAAESFVTTTTTTRKAAAARFTTCTSRLPNQFSLHRHHSSRLPGAFLSPASTTRTTRMSFHFASSEYAKCFRGMPKPNVGMLKESAVNFLDNFDEESWYRDPVRDIMIDN